MDSQGNGILLNNKKKEKYCGNPVHLKLCSGIYLKMKWGGGTKIDIDSI